MSKCIYTALSRPGSFYFPHLPFRLFLAHLVSVSDEEVISYRYSSCSSSSCCCSCCSCRGHLFSALEVCYENALYKFTFDIDIDIDIQKAQSSVVSNRIGTKFDSNILQQRTHRLTELNFRYDVIIYNFKMAAMTSFHAEMCYHLVSERLPAPTYSSVPPVPDLYGTFVYYLFSVFQIERSERPRL